MSTQNMNQFRQTAIVGELDLATNPNPNVFTCRFKDASSTDGTELSPGEPCKLIDLGSDDIVGPPIVDEMADINDGGSFGVCVYSTKDNNNTDGALVQVAGEGSVMWLEASAAIARGASVSAVLASPGEVVTATTGDILGIALDKAAGDGSMLRVLIKPVAVST